MLNFIPSSNLALFKDSTVLTFEKKSFDRGIYDVKGK